MVPNNPQPERKALITECTIDIALWLADNTATIARDETAGDCYRDIKTIIDTIERVINRPIPDRFLGPCPAIIENEHRCGHALTAPRDANEVNCRACKTVHNIDEITQRLWSEVNEWLLTPQEIHMVMEYFGEPVPASTIRRWKHEGRLQVRGWRDGKPRYWAGDVRTLRNTQPGKRMTAV